MKTSETNKNSARARKRSQNFRKLSGATPELALVVFKTHGPYSVNGSVGNRQPIGNIPTATVKLEPTATPSVVSGSAYTQVPSISNAVSQGVPSLPSSSPSPTSQEMNATSESVQEHKPLVNPQQSIRPVNPAPANVHSLNNLSQVYQLANSASITGASSIGFQTIRGTSMAVHLSNMISGGMPSSAMAGITFVPGSGALMATSQIAQSIARGSFAWTSSNILANSNISISSAMGNLQGNLGMGQSVSSLGKRSTSWGSKLGQGGIGTNQNIMNNLGPTSISSGTGTVMPMPGMLQPAGVNSLGLTYQKAQMTIRSKLWSAYKI